MAAHLLGVERSVLGRSWHERLDPQGSAFAEAIRQRHGVPDLLARALAGRGVTAADCERFLQPSLRHHLPDPDTLADVPAAVARLERAILKRERVAIFGDYDVDGAASAALLGNFLRAVGLDPLIHIPDRIREGYGPNDGAIGGFAAGGATLLVTVDCGTTSFAPLEAAARLGFDTIVIDHHRAAPTLPRACAVVNPNRHDDLSGLGHLCAAGVVFMVLVALHRQLRRREFWQGGAGPDLLAELDLVALATVADVVPLRGLNRAFVVKGLALMRQQGRPALKALFEVAGASGPPSAFSLGFLIAPRINAGGRIGDASLGARLMMTEDAEQVRRIAADLDRHNRERRVVESAAALEAEAEALLAVETAGHGDGVILCAKEGWHPGVLGLVAARLRERFGVPAFALSIEGERAVGSGRSVPGVDLGGAVLDAVAQGLLVKGGGHAMAAGVTVATEGIEAFRRFLDEALRPAMFAASHDNRRLAIDAAVSPRAVTVELVEALEAAGPFGSGNPDITFAVPDVAIRSVQAVGEGHVRVGAEGLDGARLQAVAFRAAGSPIEAALRGAMGRRLHLAGTPSVNRWGGGRAELRLLDAAVAGASRED